MAYRPTQTGRTFFTPTPEQRLGTLPASTAKIPDRERSTTIRQRQAQPRRLASTPLERRHRLDRHPRQLLAFPFQRGISTFLTAIRRFFTATRTRPVLKFSTTSCIVGHIGGSYTELYEADTPDFYFPAPATTTYYKFSAVYVGGIEGNLSTALAVNPAQETEMERRLYFGADSGSGVEPRNSTGNTGCLHTAKRHLRSRADAAKQDFHGTRLQGCAWQDSRQGVHGAKFVRAAWL